jgi:hypothetical protein
MIRYILLAALATAVACGGEDLPAIYTGSDTGLAAARSPRAKDTLIMLKDSLLAVNEPQLSHQSSLIGDAAASARLVSEIDRDLSKARIEVKGDTTPSESAIQTVSGDLTRVQRKVKVVLDRLAASEVRIRRLRSDSVARTMLNESQTAQIAEYEQSIADLRTSVENQSAELALLSSRVDSLSWVNLDLTKQNAMMAARDDSVFVAIGTEKELTEKGIIRREGGTLLAFGRGKTLVPARTFDLENFQVLSKSQDLTIALPDEEKQYRVVSRQSLAFTDVGDPKEPMVKGTLQVTDPERFWAPSKYLILVQR